MFVLNCVCNEFFQELFFVSQLSTMGGNSIEDIREIFIDSQRTSAKHQKNAIILKRLVEHCDFWECLRKIIDCVLTAAKFNHYVDNVMKFFSKFCALLRPVSQSENPEDNADQIDHPLLTDIFSYLLNASESSQDTIRLRACQLINKILDNLTGVEISQDLCENLENKLFTRLQDPKSVIRQQAIISLHWLQDPNNPDDIIISEFIRMMNSDSFAKVRQSCVEKVAPRKDVVKAFIKRIRDVDINVRLATFKRLSTLPKFLKISEKRFILQCVFTDESDKINEVLQKMLLNSWISYYDNNIIKLMKSLRLDADEKDISLTTELFENILGVLFKDASLTELTQFVQVGDNKLIPYENLDWEIVSFWRIYIQFLSKNEEFEDELSKILPELVHFSKYIKEYYLSMPKEVTTIEFLEQQYILKQLFLITKTYDYSDPATRHCLNELVHHILEKVTLNTDVTEMVISTLEHSISSINRRTQFVGEIISDILYPMDSEECQRKQEEKDYQISVLTVKLNELKEEQGHKVQQQDFLAAEQLKNEINEASMKLCELKNQPISTQREEKKSDIVTTLKCLDIGASILVSPQINTLTPALKSLKESFIQELLINENDSIRVKAFRCYALCGVVDKETASTGIHIFSTPIFAYQNGEECDTQTLLICIEAVVDFLRIYGSQLIAARENETLSESMDEEHQVVFAGGTSLTDILQGLVDLMDDEQLVIQEKAALGLCQLILSDRIASPSLITRLVLKWANPTLDEEDETNRIKQIIGFTLEKVALMSQCTEQLQDAVLLTVRTLFSAPRSSPLADVSIESIAKFMLALCKTSPEGKQIHCTIAVTICNELLNKPNNRLNPILSKILLMLDIPDSKATIQDLLNACDQIRDNIREKMTINNVLKFVTLVKAKQVVEFSVIGVIQEEVEIEE